MSDIPKIPASEIQPGDILCITLRGHAQKRLIYNVKKLDNGKLDIRFSPMYSYQCQPNELVSVIKDEAGRKMVAGWKAEREQAANPVNS